MSQPYLPHFARALLAPLLGICLAATLAAPAKGDEDVLAAQRRIEAAYLYKFGSYITWPAEAFPTPDSPFIIGVAGDDNMADELTAMVAGHSVDGRSVVVRHVHPGDAVADIHILFVAAGTPGGDALIESVRNHWTLGVTEGTDGLSHGADMTFVLVNDRVRFDVAMDAAVRDRIKISSQLLSVADKVLGAKP